MQFRRKSIACTLIIALTAAIALSGCGAGTKEQVGTVLGAGLGGLAGSFVGDGTGQLIAVAAGTLLGGFLGSEIGASLDRADMAYMSQTTHHALESSPSGQTSTWQNPDSGNGGTIVPQPAYQQADGTFCREFQQTVTIGGETHSAYGTACRQPDGNWKIVS